MKRRRYFFPACFALLVAAGFFASRAEGKMEFDQYQLIILRGVASAKELGLCLYAVGSVAEARKLAEEDPAVQAGQLRVEAMTWYCEKGAVSFPGVEKAR